MNEKMVAFKDGFEYGEDNKKWRMHGRIGMLVPGYYGEVFTPGCMGEKIRIEQVWGNDQVNIWFHGEPDGEADTEENREEIRKFLEKEHSIPCPPLDSIYDDIAAVENWDNYPLETMLSGMTVYATYLIKEASETGGDDGTYDYFPGAWEAFHYMCKALELEDLFKATEKEVREINEAYGPEGEEELLANWGD